MVRLPKMPNLPDLESALSVIDKAGDAIDAGLNIIDKVASKFDLTAEKLGPTEEKPLQSASTAETSPSPVAQGTACLPCARDHLSTSSSALSEGIRFAREKGVKDHEVMRRIRIALGELNAMERIDLAPDETAKLKGAEKELADWTLKQSRELRHAITAINDVETMEQAAARASQITEEFMGRLWTIPEEECTTCGEIRESIRQFIEKKKRERARLNP